MFTIFESSDAKKKEAVLNKRLMLLRCAYLKGYFDERETEPMPEIIADGKGPDDAGPTAYGFNHWCQQNVLYGQVPNKSVWPSIEALIEKIAEKEQRLRAEEADGLNYTKLRNALEAEAIELVCLACAGFGQRLDQDGKIIGVCPTCKGSCIDPNRAQECQHRYTTEWSNDVAFCFRCGEIIRRD